MLNFRNDIADERNDLFKQANGIEKNVPGVEVNEIIENLVQQFKLRILELFRWWSGK